MLHRLLFDTAAPDDSPNVGSYVRAGDDGTLIGHVSDALKVSFTNTSVAVTATDLDIRDLSHTQDSVKIGDGTDFIDINADGSLNITDNGGSLTVDATDFDIRDLTAASDSVAAWLNDGAGNALTSTGGALDVNMTNTLTINDEANTALAAESHTVTTTSGAAITSVLSARKFVWLYNKGSKEIYIGPSGVSTADGFPIPAGSIMDGLRIGPANAIHAVALSGSQDLRVLQAS